MSQMVLDEVPTLVAHRQKFASKPLGFMELIRGAILTFDMPLL